MTLASQLNTISDNISIHIDTLIETLGVPSTYNGEKMLAVKMFGFHAEFNSPYRKELLLDGYQVHYLTPTHAYCERGQACDLSYLIESNIETLCGIIDVLEASGYPQYTVLLRAIVEVDSVEIDQMGDEDFSFPDKWEVYDSSGEDERTIRLDTSVTVSAVNRKEAAEKAIDNPPSIGLEDYTCDINYWVDMDQADNVELIEQEQN